MYPGEELEGSCVLDHLDCNDERVVTQILIEKWESLDHLELVVKDKEFRDRGAVSPYLVSRTIVDDKYVVLATSRNLQEGCVPAGVQYTVIQVAAQWTFRQAILVARELYEYLRVLEYDRNEKCEEGTLGGDTAVTKGKPLIPFSATDMLRFTKLHNTIDKRKYWETLIADIHQRCELSPEFAQEAALW